MDIVRVAATAVGSILLACTIVLSFIMFFRRSGLVLHGFHISGYLISTGIFGVVACASSEIRVFEFSLTIFCFFLALLAYAKRSRDELPV